MLFCLGSLEPLPKPHEWQHLAADPTDWETLPGTTASALTIAILLLCSVLLCSPPQALAVAVVICANWRGHKGLSLYGQTDPSKAEDANAQTVSSRVVCTQNGPDSRSL